MAKPDQLARTLVGRKEVLHDLLDCVVKTGDGDTANHMILVGPRGIGKTHLLCLVNHYVSGRLPVPHELPDQLTGWVSVLFSEEEYARQNSLANFLLALFQKLREISPLEESWILPDDIKTQDDSSVCECCFERIREYHKKNKGRILVLIDNLQKILQQWPRDDQDRFRAFLSGQGFLLLIGSAPSVFKEVMSQKAAFHQFYEIRLIADLSTHQIIELIGNWFDEEGKRREFEERREELEKKIPAIQTLTGGNPRLVLFLCQAATRSTFLEIEFALKGLLEELREYFIRRFDELPEQPRKVLDTLAEMPGPATPKEIALAARLPLPSVNTQLARLRKNNYVKQVKLKRQRSTRYDITERLFRLWRQTATVAGRQRFRFLTDFLKLYYTPEQVFSLYKEHAILLHAESGEERSEVLRHVEELYYFQAASKGDIRCDIFSTRVESLMRVGEMRWAEQEAAYFIAESLQVGDKDAIKTAYQKQASIHLESGQFEEALKDIYALVSEGANKEALAATEKLTESTPESPEVWFLLGIAVGNLGDHERALVALRKASELGKPTAILWSLQSFALVNLYRYREALEYAEKAIALDQDDAWAWELLGRATRSLGDYERSLEAFQKASELGKPTASLWSHQALALGNLDRYQEALECAEEAIALDQDDAWAWELLGRASGSQGDYERSLEASRKASELGKPTASLWSRQALALVHLGRYQEAIECAEKAIALDRGYALAWELLGRAADNLGDYERSLEASQKASELGKPTASLWSRQAFALMQLSRYQEAIECAEKAIALEPEYAWAWELLGFATGNLGDYKRELEASRKASELGTPSARLWCCQSLALVNLDRHQEAVECAEKAITLEPEYAWAWELLGFAIGNLGDDKRALEAFRKASEFGMPSASLWNRQAFALMHMGQYQEAIECAEKAIALDSEDVWAWELLGHAVSNLEDYERALKAFGKAMELGRRTAELLTLQANSMNLLGRYQEAIIYAKEALDLNPDSKNTFYQIVWSLRKLDRSKEALNKLGEILSKNPRDHDLLLRKALVLSDLGRNEDALSAIASAEKSGAEPQSICHVRGDILTLAGQYEDAKQSLQAGFSIEPQNWDMKVGFEIVSACLGEHGSIMEALPSALAKIQIPKFSMGVVFEYILDLAARALSRDEREICRGLYEVALAMKEWHSFDWFGHQLGAFLRRVLDSAPDELPRMVSLLSQKVNNEDVLRLLDPFIQATEYMETKDVTILERLFPEVRELVQDIVQRVDPDLARTSP